MNFKHLLAAFALACACILPVAAFAKVDINSADAKTLAEGLKGIGLTKAEAIVAYREQHGAFRSPDDLAKVKGIGKKTVERNRDGIVVVGKRKAAPVDSSLDHDGDE